MLGNVEGPQSRLEIMFLEQWQDGLYTGILNGAGTGEHLWSLGDVEDSVKENLGDFFLKCTETSLR